MTKKARILLAAVIAIFVISAVFSAVILLKKPDSAKVEILQDNKLLYTLDIDEDGEYRIPGKNGGYNVVKIYRGEVYISEADCPDQTCVKMGKLDSDLPIVCLPHKLVVKFAEEN